MTSTTSVVGNFADRAYAYENSGQKYAFVELVADGNIVAAVTGQKIRLLSMVIYSPDADELTAVQLTSDDATGAKLSPSFEVGSLLTSDPDGMGDSERGFVMQPMVLPFNQAGWCETVEGEALFANLLGPGGTGAPSPDAPGVQIMVTYDETAP